MKDVIDFIENIIKAITFITLFMVIVGFLDLYIYYQYFNITITEYLGFSEIIMLSVSNMFFIFLGVLTQTYILRPIILDFNKDALDGKNTKSLLTNAFGTLLLYGIIFFIVASLSEKVIQIFFQPNFNFGLFSFLTFLFISIIIIFILFILFLKHFKNVIDYRVNYILLIMVFVTIVFQLIARNDETHTKIISKKDPLKMDFYLNDTLKVTTNDSIKYIGKTERFYFLWNKNTNTSTIYPAVAIKKVVVSEL